VDLEKRAQAPAAQHRAGQNQTAQVTVAVGEVAAQAIIVGGHVQGHGHGVGGQAQRAGHDPVDQQIADQEIVHGKGSQMQAENALGRVQPGAVAAATG